MNEPNQSDETAPRKPARYDPFGTLLEESRLRLLKFRESLQLSEISHENKPNKHGFKHLSSSYELGFLMGQLVSRKKSSANEAGEGGT